MSSELEKKTEKKTEYLSVSDIWLEVLHRKRSGEKSFVLSVYVDNYILYALRRRSGADLMKLRKVPEGLEVILMG